MMTGFSIRAARSGDEALIFSFIRDLAKYEKLSHDVVATQADVRARLFCETPRAFCDIAEVEGEPAGFAVWFFNFSTFLGRHGHYLEELPAVTDIFGFKYEDFRLENYRSHPHIKADVAV